MQHILLRTLSVTFLSTTSKSIHVRESYSNIMRVVNFLKTLNKLGINLSPDLQQRHPVTTAVEHLQLLPVDACRIFANCADFFFGVDRETGLCWWQCSMYHNQASLMERNQDDLYLHWDDLHNKKYNKLRKNNRPVFRNNIYLTAACITYASTPINSNIQYR